MGTSSQELARLAEDYCKGLAGGDVLAMVQIHANKIGLELKHVNLHRLESLVVFNVFQAANAQGKLGALVRVAHDDGVKLSYQDSDIGRDGIGRSLPRLEISRSASYLPTTEFFEDPSTKLVEGTILNPSNTRQRLTIVVSIKGASEDSKVSLDVAPGRVDIPTLRKPRFTYEEAKSLRYEVSPSVLTFDLYLPEYDRPIDSVQRDVLLTRPDIILLARENENGVLQDFSSILAWLVNPGNKKSRELITEICTPETLSKLGYVINTSEEGAIKYVYSQIKALYSGMQKLQIQFMPTESMWLDENSQIIQRIRLPDEVITNTKVSVNCIDGAILCASLIEIMGLDPILVILPKHALVGWKWLPQPLNVHDPDEVLFKCGLFDTTTLSSGLGLEASISMAEGRFLKYKELFRIDPSFLSKYARVIDIKAVRREQFRKLNG